MKLISTLLLLISCIFTAGAQNFKPQKVTIEELREKFHPKDTSAPAAILHKIGKTYFAIYSDSWNVVTEVTTRIKIYKKSGYEYANQEVPYYTGGRIIKVNFSDAYTYNLVGNEIERTRLKNDGEFTEKVNDDYQIKKITMPNVKEGSIIEYTYTITTPYFSVFRDWYFQYDIPANYVEYKITVPQFFTYNRYLAGYTKVNKLDTAASVPAGMNYREFTDVFWAENVKAIKDEAYVNNIENYTSILKHELASTNFSSGTENYSTNWGAVAKKIYEHEDFGRELNFDSYFKEDLQHIISGGVMSNEEKANKIFLFVKSRMNWNGDYGYYCDKGVKKAYESKTGNTAEINLILTAMLREAGLIANPVLISTRSNGVALFPTRTAYNYVVAGVENGKSVILFDATSKFTVPGVLPERALNWQGRMIRKDGSTADIDLMPVNNSKELIAVTASIDNEGNVAGKVRDQHHDYYAYIFKERYAEMSEDTYAEKFEKRYNGIELGDYKRTLDKDSPKPVTEEYDFVHKNMSDVIGDKIYFNPLLFFTATENPFKQEEREYPIDFGYPWQDRYMINITLPEGYVVESLPKPVSVVMEENIGSFKYNVVSQNNSVQVSVLFDVNYANVSQAYYRTLKDFFQMVIDKQNEKVVLKKA
ncbi:DUF3857 domain-containing protein [Flavobacterium sp. NRK1]|uniref:DUF3857 domain-containing protein n=1 Tax=Flavobacterium sp. NRK1 TaxID=2954929 RepID=UPI0020929854|nr:DUF3857 domain-containing protein [Flavobacterium sp. NRK1]MCO6148183.1 DUF3857 domain-containing protein [Flavobacterium sp. NRK1]